MFIRKVEFLRHILMKCSAQPLNPKIVNHHFNHSGAQFDEHDIAAGHIGNERMPDFDHHPVEPIPLFGFRSQVCAVHLGQTAAGQRGCVYRLDDPLALVEVLFDHGQQCVLV